MANFFSLGCVVWVLCSVAQLCCGSEAQDIVTTETNPEKVTPGRGGRKYYDSEIYSGSDLEVVPDIDAEAGPRTLTGTKYVPYRRVVVKKSGNNLNWNGWKGDDDNSDDNDDDSGDGPKWQQQPPQHSWGGPNEAWTADPMYVMMLKNALSDFKGPESKPPTSLLAKLTSEPALLLIAASIPISLMLAAVLPALMSYFFRESVSTITTTATGTRARDGDLEPYLTPVMEAIGTFGVRSLGNPECMQRIFCQVARDKMAVRDLRYFKKAAVVARYLSNSNWLGDFGVKDLIESLSTGNCESLKCTHSSEKEQANKSRYSSKGQSNLVEE